MPVISTAPTCVHSPFSNERLRNDKSSCKRNNSIVFKSCSEEMRRQKEKTAPKNQLHRKTCDRAIDHESPTSRNKIYSCMSSPWRCRNKSPYPSRRHGAQGRDRRKGTSTAVFSTPSPYVTYKDATGLWPVARGLKPLDTGQASAFE